MDNYDISLYQGQTFSLSLTLKDSLGVPMNLSGYSISSYIKTNYSDTAKLCDLNAVISNAASGIVTLNIPATTTASLPVNLSFYDLEMSDIGGTVTKVLAGKVSVYPEVTF